MAECLRGALATVAGRPEIHSDGNRGRCEMRLAPSSAVDHGWLRPPRERPPDESECCPNARTPFPAVRAAVEAAVPETCRLPLHDRLPISLLDAHGSNI